MKKMTLDPLLLLRRKQATVALEQVAQAQQLLERTRAHQATQKQAQEGFEHELRTKKTEELRRLQEGSLRGADLTQEIHWQTQIRKRQKQEISAAVQAEDSIRQALQLEKQAQARLADAATQVKLVEKAAQRIQIRREAQHQARHEAEEEDRIAAHQHPSTIGTYPQGKRL